MLWVFASTAHCVTSNPYKPPEGGTPSVGSGVAQLRFQTSSLTQRITKIEIDGKVVCGASGAPPCNPSANIHEMEFVTSATAGEHRLALVVETGRRWQSGPWKSHRLPAQTIVLAEGDYRCHVPDPEAAHASVTCTPTEAWAQKSAAQPAPPPPTAPPPVASAPPPPAPSPPPPSPAAPTAPGCVRDTDCKGERICRDGQCAEPSSTSACGRDTHCKGDRLCRDGKCVDP